MPCHHLMTKSPLFNRVGWKMVTTQMLNDLNHKFETKKMYITNVL